MLNAHDKALLIELRRGIHFKANPGDVLGLLRKSFETIGVSEGHSSARRLHADGLAVFVRDAEAPGRLLMRVSDSGIALADNLIEESRKKTWAERIASVARSDWIALAALLISLLALFKGD